MSRVRQSILCLAVLAVAIAAPGQLVGTKIIKTLGAATNTPSPETVVMSPVNYFRKLLMMSPTERNKSLASRTPPARTRILAKVREYLASTPQTASGEFALPLHTFALRAVRR